jgi:N12 class adenine-specific DNA methylase
MTKREKYEALISYLQGSGSAQNIQSGLGNLKELLLPIDDLTSWNATDKTFLPQAERFHKALKDRYGADYNRVLNSVRSALLTSFYTDEGIVNAMVDMFAKVPASATLGSILEPSAGTGNYVTALVKAFPYASIEAVEKDIFTGDMLSSNHPDIKVQRMGYEEDKSKGHDLIISNIPFGNFNVYDADFYKSNNKVKINSTTRIHNYYFTKSLDKLNEGGYISFLTTSGFMDSPGNTDIRKYMMENSNLISAVRLPDSAMKGEGTEVSTDIIVLQKETGKKRLSLREQDFIVSEKMVLADEVGVDHQVNFNAFFINNPDFVIGELVADGQFGNKTATAKSKITPQDLGEKLSKLLDAEYASYLAREKASSKEKKEKVVVEASKAQILPSGQELIPKELKLPAHIRKGNLMVSNGRPGRLLETEDGMRIFELLPAIKDVNFVTSIISIRNAYNNLLEAELNSASTMEKIREDLNALYDTHTWQYGALHNQPNIISFDVDSFKLFALETKTPKGYEKSQIFQRRINGIKAEFKQPKNLDEAILVSLNAFNKIDLAFIGTALKLDPEEILITGIKEDKLYLEPSLQKGKITLTPVPVDAFVSGNIGDKLEMLNVHGIDFPLPVEEYLPLHVERLKTVLPPHLPVELIEINLGERWIPEAIYQDFVEDFFKQETVLKYSKGMDEYKVSVLGYSAVNRIEFAIESHNYDGERLMENAFSGRIPNFTIEHPTRMNKKGDKPARMPDEKAIREAESKIESINQAFQAFIVSKAEVRLEVEGIYNRMFNSSVPRKFNGQHLEIPGLDRREFEPFKHQNNALYMILQRNGGLVDHKVGAGKTLVLAMAAMEMRRLGIARKPLLTALKSNAGEIAMFIQTAYPDAKILCPNEKDFTPNKRRELFMKMMNNDYDCVVITHDQFKMIPQDPEIVRRIISDEIEKLRQEKGDISGRSEVSKRMLKGIEVALTNLNAKLRESMENIKRDDELYNFRTLGFDHLLVDESHEFKNLSFTTTFDRVSGLGSPAGSERAKNMKIAVRTLQEYHGGDKGVTFASGTPISNTLGEMYLLMEYLIPSQLRELKINTFDAWAKVYAKIVSDYEFSVTSEVKKKERLRTFLKVPELLRLYQGFTDIVTDANFPVPKPEVKNVIVNLKPSLTQQNFSRCLIEFARTKDAELIGRAPLSENEEAAYMLLATNYARKMSLDMRLIDPGHDFDPGGKIGSVCDNVNKIYQRTSDFKGTQIIFCDSSVPNADGRFNAYDEIKKILTEVYKIPDREVQLIHDHDTQLRKKALVKEMNDGRVRVLIGSTVKAGTGLNIQKRGIAVHHLDCPWTPKDMEQRLGRFARQMNEMARMFNNNIVENYVYATEQTLDSYQYDILRNKQHFISQKSSTDMTLRRVEEGGLTEDGGMPFAEYVAILSGDNTLLERAKTVKKIQDLESRYTASLGVHSNARASIGKASTEVDNHTRNLLALNNDFEWLKEAEASRVKVEGESYSYPFDVKIGEVASKSTEVIGNALNKEILRRIGVYQKFDEKIGQYERFSIVLKGGTSIPFINIESTTGIKYNINSGRTNENPVLAGRYIINSIGRVERLIEATQETIREKMEAIQGFNKVLEKKFEGAEQLVALREELKDIDSRIDLKAAEKTASEQTSNQEETSQEEEIEIHKPLVRVA